MKIVVLSDLHANFYALKKALEIIDRKGFDIMIFLGDILTYGVDVKQVIDTIGNRLKNKNTFLIKGNHDQLYDDILNYKNTPYLETLPAWIRESVNFTAEKINKSDWKKLNFLDFYSHNNVYYGHANPFSKNNWTYLNNSKNLVEASKILKKKNFFIGVFGHTHRILNSTFSKKNILKKNTLFSSVLTGDKVHILNAGSVGQPRNIKNSKSSFLYLNFKEKNESYIKKKTQYDYEVKFFNYSLNSHLKAIRKSLMSQSTKEKLLSFY